MKYMTYVKLPLHLLDSCHTSVKETWSLWGVQDPIENFVVSMLMNLGGILGYSNNQMFLKGWTLKLWSWTSTKQFLSFPHLSWFKRQMYSQELSWKIPSLRPQNSYGSYGHCLSRKHLHLPEIVSPCAQILIPWSNHRRSGREEQGQEHVSHPQLQRLRWPCEWSGSSCYYEAISIVIRKRCMNIYILYIFLFQKTWVSWKTWNQVKPAIITAWRCVEWSINSCSWWWKSVEALWCSRATADRAASAHPFSSLDLSKRSDQGMRTWPEIQSFLVVIHLILCTSSRNGNARLKKVWVWEICKFWNIAAHWNSIPKKSTRKNDGKGHPRTILPSSFSSPQFQEILLSSPLSSLFTWLCFLL